MKKKVVKKAVVPNSLSKAVDNAIEELRTIYLNQNQKLNDSKSNANRKRN